MLTQDITHSTLSNLPTHDALVKYLPELTEAAQDHSYSKPFGSVGLPDDSETLKLVEDMAAELAGDSLKYVVDIGIGGSNLGAKAVYDALRGYKDVFAANNYPKILFADTNDPEYLQALVTFLKQNVKNPEEVIINVISKSGGTTETITNAEIVLAALSELDVKDRIVVTTEKTSPMGQATEKLGYRFLPHPNVGGRYSIFSTVGLFPLACAGINIKALRDGAARMRTACLSQTMNENPAMQSATILHTLLEKGFVIHDLFFFHTELESLGKWYRQLMGESIGKEHDLDGKQVFAGMTPTVSIGSTDLHSMAQLYMGGPRNKVTTFISSKKTDPIKTPASFVFDGLVPHITDRPVSEIMSAILEGTKIAYSKQGLPFMSLVLDAVDEESIGAFMQMKMIEMMLLARLMHVDAFDQPHVELYKVETKQILSGE